MQTIRLLGVYQQVMRIKQRRARVVRVAQRTALQITNERLRWRGKLTKGRIVQRDDERRGMRIFRGV